MTAVSNTIENTDPSTKLLPLLRQASQFDSRRRKGGGEKEGKREEEEEEEEEGVWEIADDYFKS